LGVSASILSETSAIVSTQKGKEVPPEYDLTQYEQDKQYRVILKGSYSLRKHTFTYDNGGGPKTVQGGESLKMDQDNMVVTLVSR
jgi:hypothetical protein